MLLSWLCYSFGYAIPHFTRLSAVVSPVHRGTALLFCTELDVLPIWRFKDERCQSYAEARLPASKYKRAGSEFTCRLWWLVHPDSDSVVMALTRRPVMAKGTGRAEQARCQGPNPVP